MSDKAETVVAHLLVYLEAVFGPIIHQFLSPEHRSKMSQFVYFIEAKQVIDVQDNSDDKSSDSTEYTLSTIGDGFGVPNI